MRKNHWTAVWMPLCVLAVAAAAWADDGEALAGQIVPKIVAANWDFGSLVLDLSSAKCTYELTVETDFEISAAGEIQFEWTDKNNDRILGPDEVTAKVTVTKVNAAEEQQEQIRGQIQKLLADELVEDAVVSAATIFRQCKATAKKTDDGYQLTLTAREGQPMRDLVGAVPIAVTVGKDFKVLETKVKQQDGMMLTTRFKHAEKQQDGKWVKNGFESTTAAGETVSSRENGTETLAKIGGVLLRKKIVVRVTEYEDGEESNAEFTLVVKAGSWKVKPRPGRTPATRPATAPATPPDCPPAEPES